MIRVLSFYEELKTLGEQIALPEEKVIVVDSEKKLIEFIRQDGDGKFLVGITPSFEFKGDSIDSMLDYDSTIIFVLDDNNVRDPKSYVQKMDDIQQSTDIVRKAIIGQYFLCTEVFKWIDLNSIIITPENNIAGKIGYSIQLKFKSQWI